MRSSIESPLYSSILLGVVRDGEPMNNNHYLDKKRLEFDITEFCTIVCLNARDGLVDC